MRKYPKLHKKNHKAGSDHVFRRTDINVAVGLRTFSLENLVFTLDIIGYGSNSMTH